ncbi:MAG: 3-hydroxyacyl-ACP dehydratase FabZ [Clostridia bacterium]|nr:3-hydroxyacyl-ACP dehydratase FabZ [Clostridia bacterium]
MDKEQLMQLLPHRDNMLLLDSVDKEGEEAVGKYYVLGDEFFLKGHFPAKPVVPGVILCEILAQSACVLLTDSMKEGTIPMYAGLDKVRFRAPVVPGDTIETRCHITRAKHPFYFAEGKATVGGKVCVTAEFSFVITGA